MPSGILILVAVAGLALPGLAIAETQNRGWVGLGHWVHNAFGRTTTEVSGATGFSGASFTGLEAGARFGNERIGFLAETYLTLLPSQDADSEGLGISVSRAVHALWVGVEVRVDRFCFGVGPGFQVYSLSGEGGAVTLNNGNSTSTFFRPAGDTSTRQGTLNLMAGGWIADRVRVTGSLVAAAPFAHERRTWSLLFAAAWGWGFQ